MLLAFGALAGLGLVTAAAPASGGVASRDAGAFLVELSIVAEHAPAYRTRLALTENSCATVDDHEGPLDHEITACGRGLVDGRLELAVSVKRTDRGRDDTVARRFELRTRVAPGVQVELGALHTPQDTLRIDAKVVPSAP